MKRLIEIYAGETFAPSITSDQFVEQFEYDADIMMEPFDYQGLQIVPYEEGYFITIEPGHALYNAEQRTFLNMVGALNNILEQ